MEILVCESKIDLGREAAQRGAQFIRDAIAAHGEAHIVVATGASQFQTLAALVEAHDLDWSRVTAFHLDEYVGMAPSHPASFRRYLEERFLSKLPVPPRAFHPVGGQGDPQAECKRLNALISRAPIDVCFVGIGENGHLAFNDPPADFDTEDPFIVVELDEDCRRQQMGEGWFLDLNAVPRRAISMSIRQIMSAKAVICSVPDERKARAVQLCLGGPVTPLAPASILQHHPEALIYLDPASASLLDPASVGALA